MKFIFPGVLLLLVVAVFIANPFYVLAIVGILVGILIYDSESMSFETKRNWGIGIAIVIGLYLLQLSGG